MRSTLPTFACVLAFVCLAAPAAAQEPRASIQGFGGLPLGSLSPSDSSFGGLVTLDLTPNIQVIGEAGRMGNVLSPTVDLLLGLVPGNFGLGTSAWYGEGGVRFTTGSSGIRPYVETSGGIARLQTRVTGLDTGGALANAALQFLDSTSPMASVGGGVSFVAGSLVADVGYRYRRIFSDSWVNALAFGQGLDQSEVRVGIGVRF
jgi:opacity protein-like surface antigen